MPKKKYVYWQVEDMWLGYLDEYPDYMSQGKTLDELKENLRDIFGTWGAGRSLQFVEWQSWKWHETPGIDPESGAYGLRLYSSWGPARLVP